MSRRKGYGSSSAPDDNNADLKAAQAAMIRDCYEDATQAGMTNPVVCFLDPAAPEAREMIHRHLSWMLYKTRAKIMQPDGSLTLAVPEFVEGEPKLMAWGTDHFFDMLKDMGCPPAHLAEFAIIQTIPNGHYCWVVVINPTQRLVAPMPSRTTEEPNKISKAALTTTARELTKDPEWCVNNLFPPVPLPSVDDYKNLVRTTWEFKVSLEAAKRLGQSGEITSFWLNACNVCEDAKAENIPTPKDQAEFLAAMVLDYRSNLQAFLLGPGSAGRSFISDMSVKDAASKLIRMMTGR